MEFEWIIFPGHTTLKILLGIQKLLELDCEPETIRRKNHLHVDVNLKMQRLLLTFFQDSNVMSVYDHGDNDAEPPGAEIDDEHIRNVLASPLYVQEREKQMRV